MQFNWGIIGTGGIAHTFARALKYSLTGVAAAVGSRGLEKARTFALEFDIPHAHGSYDDLLADPQVQGVYIALPHPLHHHWALRAIAAGKHILCEKPFALNFRQSAQMVAAAEAAGVMIMEAFMYRCHPQTAKLVELLRENVVGEVRSIVAAFSFKAPFDPASRLFAENLGGGGIMDVGCYPVSMSRLIAGASRGQNFANPLEVKGIARLGPTGVDHWAAACLRFPGDILAQIASGVEVQQENVVRIFGSEGSMFLPNPWVAGREKGDPGTIILQRGGVTRDVTVPGERTSFSYEADVFAQAIFDGSLKPAYPAMSTDDTLGQMATLDRWRQSVGVSYTEEAADPNTLPTST